jgi:hypothetical protein
MDFINEKLYDMKLITVQDYTIAGEIPPEMWLHYRTKHIFTKNVVLSFEEKLRNVIEIGLQTKCGLTKEQC